MCTKVFRLQDLSLSNDFVKTKRKTRSLSNSYEFFVSLYKGLQDTADSTRIKKEWFVFFFSLCGTQKKV